MGGCWPEEANPQIPEGCQSRPGAGGRQCPRQWPPCCENRLGMEYISSWWCCTSFWAVSLHGLIAVKDGFFVTGIQKGDEIVAS